MVCAHWLRRRWDQLRCDVCIQCVWVCVLSVCVCMLSALQYMHTPNASESTRMSFTKRTKKVKMHILHTLKHIQLERMLLHMISIGLWPSVPRMHDNNTQTLVSCICETDKRFLSIWCGLDAYRKHNTMRNYEKDTLSKCCLYVNEHWMMLDHLWQEVLSPRILLHIHPYICILLEYFMPCVSVCC